MPVTTRQVLIDALVELGVYSIAENPSAADLQVALGKLNRLLDNWNAERAAVYADTFVSYTLVPNLQPHTIGPAAETPTWTATQRPVAIAGASVVLDNVTPAVYTPITLRDAQWWHDQTVPGVTSEFPTDLYYEPGWPLGSLYFWPVPTVAYGLELQLRIVLAELDLADTFSLPPGYKDAITLTVAEQCARPFGKPVQPDLRMDAARARARIFGNNDTTPRLATQDAGMPSKGRPYFNYRTGLPC